MKYTVVFEWPDGPEPAVSRTDTWNGYKRCAVQFTNLHNELEYMMPKLVQEALETPHPMSCLHINQGSLDAAADAYEAEYNKAHGVEEQRERP